MKKTKPGISGVHDAENLYRETALRRHKPLVLPRFLKEEAFRISNRADEIAAAHKIILRWADLASKGKLNKKETELDDAFRLEVFGTALRYTPYTQNPDKFYFQKGFRTVGWQEPDGVLGNFPPVEAKSIRAILELKGASADLDHDKSDGRTAVEQCWDYLDNLPNCPWGIVSNFVSFRLYHRNKTREAFEYFELEKLRDLDEFTRFFTIFERDGLLRGYAAKTSRVEDLIERSDNRQKEVGDKLYNYYSEQRIRLIQHLIAHHGKTPDLALKAAQKLLDRIIFIAFCEDRGLLPAKLIESTWSAAAPLARATNPRWQAFLDTFYAIDKGHPNLGLPTGYNGGLFAEDPNIDSLQLEDDWTNIFQKIGEYDFQEDVSVDVLGHLFEKSVSEVEKLRQTSAFFIDAAADAPAMPKSAERKRFGIYYTPPEFTAFIVRHTVGAIVQERFNALAAQHGVEPETSMRVPPALALADYSRACLAALRQITVVDPACGSGAFLIAAYQLLEDEYRAVVANLSRHSGEPISTWESAIPAMILTENLYGMDLSKEAAGITELALWIRSARKNVALSNLSGNIIHGNSLVTDPAVHPDAREWEKVFPQIFNRAHGGFDCVIGNPPWERMKLQEREFFAFARPDIASAVNAADRRKLIARLAVEHPELQKQYEAAIASATRTLDHVRNSGHFPLTGRGDINTYMVFAELARKIVRPTGRVGLLVPSGIATDDTTKEFFKTLMDGQSLIAVYDFENRRKVFPDVDGRFKFSILLLGGGLVKTAQADFVSFAHEMRHLLEKKRHIALSAKDLALLNPNTHTCPIFRTRRDAELTKAIYRRVPVLIDENRKAGGNPWGIRFIRMFDQTNDAEHFLDPTALKSMRARLTGNRWTIGAAVFLPLYEAKMVQVYDHRAASVVIKEGNWVRQGQTEPTTLVEHQNPEFVAQPRWWSNEVEVTRLLEGEKRSDRGFIAFKDITSPTNLRTMIAAVVPWCAATNHLILTLTSQSPRRELCLLANLNSFAYDYVTRQKIGGVTLNFFIVKQIPTFPPDTYADKCPWDKTQTLEKWISDRVLKLTCTADDMRPLAEAAGFKEGVHKWKEPERAMLRAELDAAYFLLYGLNREDAEYILTTFSGMSEEDAGASTSAASAILEAYDALARGSGSV